MIIKDIPEEIELKSSTVSDENIKILGELNKASSSIENENTLKESMELLLI